MTNTHISVLLEEAVDGLEVQKGGWYVDGTFGRGGHTKKIMEKGGCVIALDMDAEAIAYGESAFAEEIHQGKLLLVRANFDQLEQQVNELKTKHSIPEINGLLFDFGVSSPQIDQPERGFSFQHDVELDMRMDDRLGVKAKDLLALLSEKQLTEIFVEFGGEHEAYKIAKAIVAQRTKHPITTTQQLANLIQNTKKERHSHLNPATKVFQALRIAVNSELDSIEQVLPQALRVLASNSYLVTISFHEGEDRLVKTSFKNWQKQGWGEQVNKDVIVPGDEETTLNPRSRSAKLRIFKKVKVANEYE
ncbi:16S rRNA (cytosine(1402)-N(4))-methyltransferase RsmH [soil metagenome]